MEQRSARGTRPTTGASASAAPSRLRNVSPEVAAAALLAESEARFRMLAENASDLVYEVSPEGVILWISPSVELLLGHHPDALIGTPAFDLLAPEDHGAMLPLRSHLWSGHDVEAVEVRYLTSSDDRRWMSVRAHPLFDAERQITGAVLGVRDCHAEVLARRAASTLSAGNAALGHATTEDQLLHAICTAAVDHGGYLFAWYGRPVDDEDRSIVPVAMAGAHQAYLDEISVSWGEGPLGQGPTGTSIRTGMTQKVNDFGAIDAFSPWREAATSRGFRSSISLPVVVDGEVDGALMVYAGEPDAWTAESSSVMEDLARQLGFGLGRLRDLERIARESAQRALLSTAIDQAVEAVLITDTSFEIVYANPAAARSSGYPMEEILGATPFIFQSDVQPPEFFEDMWTTILEGRPWHGVFVNRRRDGELYEEDTTITPVLGEDGEVVAYVAVKNDLSHERQLEAGLERELGDRRALVAVLASVRPGETFATNAASLCDAVMAIDLVLDCRLLVFGYDGAVVHYGGPADGGAVGIVNGARVDRWASADFEALLADGPWWLDVNGPVAPMVMPADELASLAEQQTASVGLVPLRHAGALVGALALASTQDVDSIAARDELFVEVADLVGGLLGEQAAHERSVRDRRAAVERIIAEAAFSTVFQPFVDLRTGETLGYEALTRFADGRRPDLVFAEAHEVGLGSALEATCAAAAIEACRPVPADLLVSVNFSPDAILDGHAAEVLATAHRPLVVEITEHVPVDSYGRLAEALSGLPDVKISVDDAGSGYASLRHVLELRPDVLKMDIALVRGIDSDPTRQAMAAGLRHFTQSTGTVLIAEGVETEAEAETLRALGVDLAQGFLYGRPAPLETRVR